jgi:glycosyltransferase involved in cell wall biosynthesis
MKLLIITQKVDANDDNLGFFHGWIEEFAKNCESVIVICLQKGEYELPANVKILSLGKPASRLKYLFNFYNYIWRERKNYDAVFVHMNPRYVVLGGLFWKFFSKKIYLWYTHKSVNMDLRIAEWFVFRIFTASPESCRLKSDKIIITGHGIDTWKFKIPNSPPTGDLPQGDKFQIITAGRISPAKNLDVLVKTAEILKNKNFNFEIEIAGAPIFETDKIYFERVKKLIREAGLEEKVKFVGAIPYRNISEFYQNGDLFVNFSDTGSIDKAMLEAMASGLLVLTSNEAFKNILEKKYVTSKNPGEIVEKIMALSRSEFDFGLREYVVKNHSLSGLIIKIISLI